MKHITPAPSTVSRIYYELGDTKDLEEGFVKKGNILGQKVEKSESGEFYSPMTFEYTANVVREDDKLKWDIIEVKPLN